MTIETPTPYRKDKIGSHLSYPLKFSEVQSLLSPAFAQLELQVWFSASKAPRQHERRESYPIMEARRCWLRPVRANAHWELTVHPLPRELRGYVRSLLIPSGTDRLRAWYLAAHSPVWLAESHELRVRFVPATESLEYDER